MNDKSSLKTKQRIARYMYMLLPVICIIFMAFLNSNDALEELDFSGYKEVTVKRVVDGDTFIYTENGSDVRVRLIGIDTPESVAPEETGKVNTVEGKEVSNYVKDLITGKTLYLEYDVEQLDQFGRELAYAYLPDGRMLQEILLEKGYAILMTIKPNTKYAGRFNEIYTQAQSAGK